jgi:hypothetical protein
MPGHEPVLAATRTQGLPGVGAQTLGPQGSSSIGPAGPHSGAHCHPELGHPATGPGQAGRVAVGGNARCPGLFQGWQRTPKGQASSSPAGSCGSPGSPS